VASNEGFVSVGVDHDTPVFAVKSIEAWWTKVGQLRYPNARELYITLMLAAATVLAHTFGNSSSNGSRTH
jgi:hypothetical protein